MKPRTTSQTWSRRASFRHDGGIRGADFPLQDLLAAGVGAEE
jgi:hypothetical protein